MTFHPILSPSPVKKAFCFVTSQHQDSSTGGVGRFSSYADSFAWNRDNESDDETHGGNASPFWLSSPEWSLLQSAEENPLEYTLAERDDAVSYLRILFKMLDQVTRHLGTSTVGSSPVMNGRVVPKQTFHNDWRSQMELDSPPIDTEDEAFDLYYRSTKQNKQIIVSHYCVDKIYEIIGISLDNERRDGHQDQPSPRRRRRRIPSLCELFHDFPENNKHDDELITMRLEDDDWRPLLKILYNRSVDDYTKRGSALILAYILRARCQQQQTQAEITPSQDEQPDEDLLDLFSEEHKTIDSIRMETIQIRDKNLVQETLQSLISWLTARLQSSEKFTSLGVVTPTLSILLSTTKQARVAFYQSGGIGYLVRHIKAKRIRKRPTIDLSRAVSADPVQTNRRVNSTFATSSPTEGVPSPTTIRQRSKKTSRKLPTHNPFSDTASVTSTNSFSSTTTSNNPFGGVVETMVDNMESMVRDSNYKINHLISSAAEKARADPASVVGSTMNTAGDSPPQSARKRMVVPSSSVQQIYDFVFCLWCMSLDCSTDERVRNLFARDGVVSALAHLLKKAPREKVLRLTLACLRSLAELDKSTGCESSTMHEGTSFAKDMVGSGVMKSLETIRGRRWNDEDLELDLEYLYQLLNEKTQDYTHFSVYKAHIESGNLRWDDLLHTSEFFERNARHMEIDNFGIVRSLIQTLYTNTKSGRLRSTGKVHQISYVGLNEVISWDEDDVQDDDICEILAVCLFDLGEFVRHYPNGKSVLTRLDGCSAKSLVMHYVNHPREDVREQALLCASKLLVNNWRAITN